MTELTGSVVDCSFWPDEYSQAILARYECWCRRYLGVGAETRWWDTMVRHVRMRRYPRCTIAFVSAPDVSTSGYSIVLSLEGGRKAGGISGQGLWAGNGSIARLWSTISMGMTPEDAFTLVASALLVSRMLV